MRLTLFRAALLNLLATDDAAETAPKPGDAADSTGETWTRDQKHGPPIQHYNQIEIPKVTCANRGG